jgi:hypothetical protein
MIEKVIVTKKLGLSADAVWVAISGIGGLDRWFPVIASCTVEGDGVGAIRMLGLADGGRMKDRIEEIDHEKRRFRYARTELPFPVGRYLGTVEVRGADGRNSEISWMIEMEVAPEDRDALVGFIETALSDGIAGMERDLRQGR